MDVLPFEPKYHFVKIPIQILIKPQHLEPLISVFANALHGEFMNLDNEDIEDIDGIDELVKPDITFVLNSFLEDLYDLLLLHWESEKVPILSIHVLEIDYFISAIEQQKDDVAGNDKRILTEYIEMLLPFRKTYESEIRNYSNLPLDTQKHILETLYRRPYGAIVTNKIS
ncbi:hypothetical protein [Pueribacillus sp. YX66]|uniref:hypothetical protein n=1 Tax=Pueribacillus sp. YX66 TaxID=3229242 RepID=UPI00358D31E9